MKRKWLSGAIVSMLILGSLSGCGGSADYSYDDYSEDEVETATVSQAEVRPVDDFYRYVNGEALANAEFEYGADKAAEAFDESIINDELDGIAKDVIAGNGYDPGTEEYIIKNAYESYLKYDFENAGVPEDLDEMFREIDKAGSVEELLSLDAKISKEYATANLLNISVGINYLESGKNVLTFEQRTKLLDADFGALEESYDSLNDLRDYASDFLQALGHDKDSADETGTNLAYIAMDIYNKTDIKISEDLNNYKHFQLYSRDDIDKIFTNIDLEKYLSEMGINTSYAESFGVYDADQLEAVNAAFAEENLEALKAWRICSLGSVYGSFVYQGYPELADYASKSYDTPEERAMYDITADYKNLLDVLYVEQYYSDETDKALISMCDDIKAQYRILIGDADWISEETKAGLLKKLDNIVYVTGKNVERHDTSEYEKLNFDNYYEFYVEYSRIDYDKKLDSLTKPLDRSKPNMLMQTFNACYDPSFNNITITVAITNAPYFDSKADYYTNLGGLGMVIAHEMGHAFDSNCILFDSEGAYNPDWISEEDRNIMEDRNKATISYFEDNFTLFGIYHVDGEQTLGENYADLGAMECITAIPDNDDDRKKLFENYATIWCEKTLDTALIDDIASDAHSPAIIRVNAILSTLDTFYETYDVSEGDGMYIAPEKRVSRWY